MVHDIFAAVHPGTFIPSLPPFPQTTDVPNNNQESAPARYRGLMISIFQIWTSIGSLIGTIIDNATHDMPGRNAYIIPLGTIFIVPFFLSIGLFFIPESPRWLILVERSAQAETALLWMRPHPETVPAEIAEIQAAIDAEKAVKSSANFLDIWRDPVDRRRTLLAIAAVSTQAASGAMFMIAYGTYFFQVRTISSVILLLERAVVCVRACVLWRANKETDGECRKPVYELVYPDRRRRLCHHGE